MIIKKICIIKINPDGIHTPQGVNIENLQEAIYRRGFCLVQLPRDLDKTTPKVQINQSCGVLAAVMKSKML